MIVTSKVDKDSFSEKVLQIFLIKFYFAFVWLKIYFWDIGYGSDLKVKGKLTQDQECSNDMETT